MFNNIKIKFKLFLGFGLIIAVTLAMSLIAFIQIGDINKRYSDVLDVTVFQSKSITEAGWSYAKMRRTTTAYIVYAGNTEKLDSLRNEYITEFNKLNSNFDDFNSSIVNDKALSSETIRTRQALAVDARTTINNVYDSMSGRIFEMAMEGNMKDAAYELNEGMEKAHGADDIINKLIAESVESMELQSAAANQISGTSRIAMLGIAAVSIILSIICALFISNSITKRVNSVSNAAHKISVGDFDALMSSNNKDEIGDLSNSLLLVKETIHRLIRDIKKLSDEFIKGDIEAYINESSYQGEFQIAVKTINETYAALIDDTLEAIREVTEFGNGNFDVAIKELPGKKVIMTDSFKAVQNNLKQFNSDIGGILKGASDGNLDISMDSSKFKGDWNKMATGINAMISAVVEPIREVISVLNQLSNGNLQLTVNGNYKGEFAKMKFALNNTLTMLLSYINEIGDVLGYMSKQDLTKAITREYAGDFTAMKVSINKISDTFNKMLKEINDAAEQVAVSANQISESSFGIAQGTTEQASSVEELNATIEGISAQTSQTAQYAHNVSELALTAKESAETGNLEMKSMLEAMEKINDSSASISKIIKVIDDIAFQTNLLALNAAVEAARAGQQGKGFAVVAEEVRNLAGRSKDAAMETSELIEESVSTVEKGLVLAGKTAQTFEKIVNEISEISLIAGEVSNASEQQSEAVSQVNIGVSQISSVIQANSSTSEEQAAASENLSDNAVQVKNMIGKFKLKE